MNFSILKSTYAVSSFHAYEGLKYSTVTLAKKISQLIETKIDLNQVAIISTIGLAAIAVLASIYTSSFLALALAVALCATSCLTYKINLELQEKNGECKKQYNYILNEERHKKDRLEEHQRMNASIDKLTDQLKHQKSVTDQLEQQLNRSLELVDYCDKALEKLADIKSTAQDLGDFKTILHAWLEQIKYTNPDEERERFSQKILQILQDFREGSRRELSNMLTELANIQQQLVLTQKQLTLTQQNIASSTKNLDRISHNIEARIEEQKELDERIQLSSKNLDRISHDIEARIKQQKELDETIQARTQELMAIHHQLTILHKELAELAQTRKK